MTEHSEDNSIHVEHLPIVDLGGQQQGVTVITIFAVGASKHDCAAYRAIIPQGHIGTETHDAIVKAARGGGNKITEGEARSLFEFGDLVWRP